MSLHEKNTQSSGDPHLNPIDSSIGHPLRKPYCIYAITRHGVDIARQLVAALPGSDLYVSEKFLDLAPESALKLPLPFGPMLTSNFKEYDCHIFIISVGAVVRMIAPLLKSKKVDPAVLCIDDAAKFVICTLSGHVGRGNVFTNRVAQVVGAIPVVTTASDVRGTLTVDILGRDLGWTLSDPDFNVTRGCAAVVNEEPVCFVQETGEPDWWPATQPLPPGVVYRTSLDEVNPEQYSVLLIASDRIVKRTHPRHSAHAVQYYPKSLVIGLGCDRGTPMALLERGILNHFAEAGLALPAVCSLATIDIKADEPGIQELCRKYGWSMITYPAATLDQVLDQVPDEVKAIINPSETVKKHTGTRGVCEPAAMLAAGADRLCLTKQKYTEPDAGRSMTLAVARKVYPSKGVIL